MATEPDVEGSSANGGPDEPMRYGKWSVRATLVSVRDLDRSALFYKIVMGLTEITRTDQIAVLGRPSEDSPEVVLRVAFRVAGRLVRPSVSGQFHSMLILRGPRPSRMLTPRAPRLP